MEHARFAGVLASLWGNVQFQRPPIDPDAFVAGVSLHDRGYGHGDAADLSTIPDREWLEITRRGFYASCSDPVVDLIVKHHLKRLAGSDPLASEMEAAIQELLQRHSLRGETFALVDRITNLCDRIALAFCFEKPARGEVAVARDAVGSELITVRYAISGSLVQVDPWPFSVPAYDTFVIAFRAQGYPAALDPVIIPVHLRPVTLDGHSSGTIQGQGDYPS